MDRLNGVGRFLAIVVGVLLALRVVHVGVPLVFPYTIPGPLALESLDEVRARVGFAPLVPAYRPALLGERHTRLEVQVGSHPTFEIAWRDERYLIVTQRRGGSRPAEPPEARPLPEVADSMWWRDGARLHLVLRRGDFWVTVETDLPFRDLQRIADTLREYN